MSQIGVQSSSYPVKLTVCSLIFVLIGFSIFGSFYQTERRVTAEAELVSSNGENLILAPSAGKIQSLEINTGDIVKKGQVLGSLYIPHSSPKEVHDILSALNQNYDALVKYSGQTDLDEVFPPWIEMHTENLELLSIVESAMRAWADFRVADRKFKFYSQTVLTHLNLQILSHKAALKRQTQSKLSASSKQERENETAELEFKKQLSIEETNISWEQAKIEGLTLLKKCKLEASEFDARYRFSAESEGVIGEVMARKGQALNKDEPISRINSASNDLEALLYVSLSSSRGVQVGQQVFIKFEVLGQNKTNLVSGRIIRIFAVRNLAIGKANQAYLPVIVNLEKSDLLERSPAADKALAQGLKGHAYINTGQISLVKMVFETLFKRVD